MKKQKFNIFREFIKKPEQKLGLTKEIRTIELSSGNGIFIETRPLKCEVSELLSSDLNILIPALQYLSDELRYKGIEPSDVEKVLAILYERLATESSSDVQEHILHALEQAYYNQAFFNASVLPLKSFFQRTQGLFAERIFEAIWFSRQKEHFDIFEKALQSSLPSVQRQVAPIIQRMEKNNEWPLNS